MNIEEVSESLKQFGVWDYGVLAILLGCCSVVGLYFGFKDFVKRKAANNDESEAQNFLMGGRQLSTFPVALSLIASLVSGVLLLGASTEIYLFGSQYLSIIIAIVISAAVLHFIMIPIFHELHITSVYEYLQKRFNLNIRLFGALMYTISTILWCPIMLYVPAMAFNQMTGISIHTLTPIVMSICILYTCLGGIKAVVWSDVIQISIMYGTLFLIAILGTLNVGGFSQVISKNLKSGRIEIPDFRLDPTIRHSFWSLVIGGSILYTSHNSLNQNMIQRYLLLRSVKAAQRSNMIFVIGFIIMILLCSYNGFVLYAMYFGCDPLTTKLAKAKDQLVPLLVMELFRDIPGLPGVFISGILSAALSSISTGLNSMSAVVLEDFFKTFHKERMSERMMTIITRSTVIILGVISICLVYVVEHMGPILQLTLSIPTACFGPLFGVYIIGIFLPWVNIRATLYAAIIGFISMMCFVFEVQREMALGLIKFPMKPTSIEDCNYNFNSTVVPSPNNSFEEQDLSSNFATISYLYYTSIGTLIVLISSILLTLVFGFEDVSKIDQKLLAPFVRRRNNEISNIEMK